MKNLFLITIFLVYCLGLQAQYLTAYEDAQKNFWVFEAGMFNQLEDSDIQEFQVGGTLVAYLDQASNFKIFQYGNVQTLLEVAQVNFKATDYLLGYSLFDTLYVYDGDKNIKLSSNCEEYLVMDSLIVWQNRSDKSLKAFYKGSISTIAEDLPDFKFEPYMAGDNLFAFVNSYNDDFTIFYHGKLIVLDAQADEMNYKSGCDIIAFMDLRDQSFNVFYKGDIKQLDLYKPKSFKVGDQIMAYINNQDEMLFFENGDIESITAEPEFYDVKDHILVFEEQGSLKTFCNGQNYIIEQYIPQPYYIDENTIAYLEHNESIRVFQYCKHITANKIDVVKFNMVRDIIVYSENEYSTKVYFNGQVYENE